MSPVAAQVHRYSVSAGQVGQQSRRYGVRLRGLPGLTNGCDMIHIYSQPGHFASLDTRIIADADLILAHPRAVIDELRMTNDE
jgi:hypothetical protein